MRKILWYTSSKETGDKGVPIYYTGPWWAFLIHDILFNVGSDFIDWAMDIEGKYLEPEDEDGNKTDIDGLDPMDGTAGYTDSK